MQFFEFDIKKNKYLTKRIKIFSMKKHLKLETET